MVKEAYGGTETAAERWFLEYQDQIKLNKLTSFINIQQMTKAGQFSGSNRMKHMTDAMALIKRIGPDSSERVIQFDKNRDGDISQKIYFTISNDHVMYNFETE
jgi:predicted ATP-dependent serine protease